MNEGFTTQWQHEASYLLYNRMRDNGVFQPSEADIARFMTSRPTTVRKGPKTLEVMEFTVKGAEADQMEKEVAEFRRTEFQRFLNAENAIKDIIYKHKRNGTNPVRHEEN